jgi:DNA-binding NarL/FixJ family response regulator
VDVLLIESDPLTRDRVLVGLQQFPEIKVTVGEGYGALNEARQHKFDCVFFGVDPGSRQGFRLLEHLREFDSRTEVVVITTERHARDMQQLKSRMKIVSFLTTPIAVDEFFGLVGRLRRRHRPSGSSAPTSKAR